MKFYPGESTWESFDEDGFVHKAKYSDTTRQRQYVNEWVTKINDIFDSLIDLYHSYIKLNKL